MATVIIWSKNDEYITHWKQNLESIGVQCFVKASKSEVFECLSKQKTNSLLLIESDFVDNPSFLTLLKRSYSWVKVLIFSYRVDQKDALIYKEHDVKAYVHAFLNISLTKDMLRCVQNGDIWYSTDFLDTFEPEEVEDEFLRIRGDKRVKEFINDDMLMIDEKIDDEFSFEGFTDDFLNQTFAEAIDENIAKYSGNFKEYDIKIPKNLTNTLIINDTIMHRDGCDLVNDDIEKLKFADTIISLRDLYKKVEI